MRTPKIAKPIPADELPSFLACVRYGRRLPGNEVFELEKVVWMDLLTTGHTMATKMQGLFPAFTLEEAQHLPKEADWNHNRAKIVMQVRRRLPPYHSRQTYVISASLNAVMKAVPKDVKKPTVWARKPVPIVVRRKLLTE